MTQKPCVQPALKYLPILWNWLSLEQRTLSPSQQLASGLSESLLATWWIRPLVGLSGSFFDARWMEEKPPRQSNWEACWDLQWLRHYCLALYLILKTVTHSPVTEILWWPFTHIFSGSSACTLIFRHFRLKASPAGPLPWAFLAADKSVLVLRLILSNLIFRKIKPILYMPHNL